MTNSKPLPVSFRALLVVFGLVGTLTVLSPATINCSSATGYGFNPFNCRGRQ